MRYLKGFFYVIAHTTPRVSLTRRPDYFSKRRDVKRLELHNIMFWILV